MTRMRIKHRRTWTRTRKGSRGRRERKEEDEEGDKLRWSLGGENQKVKEEKRRDGWQADFVQGWRGMRSAGEGEEHTDGGKTCSEEGEGDL